jgi:hypothetical protein
MSKTGEKGFAGISIKTPTPKPYPGPAPVGSSSFPDWVKKDLEWKESQPTDQYS